MAEVTPLHPKPNDILVGELERMLQQARVGEIQTIAYVAIFESGDSDNGWAMNDDKNIVVRLLGEICLLRAELEDDILDSIETYPL